MFRFLPEQASEHAAEMDWIHHWVTDISVFFTVAIVGAMLYFAVKYRKRGGVDHETPRIEGSHFLELVWTIVPTIICIFVAWEGVRIFKDIRKVPADALTLYATGSQWKWDFEYDTGKKTTNNFVLPVNKPVKIVITSQDVLHSFFLPSMRVKVDAVKGLYNYVTFKPIKTGDYRLFCTEYCGKDHSAMLGTLSIVSENEYTRWVNDKSEKQTSPIERGKLLYVEKACKSCHTLDGTRGLGPSWLKLYGKTGKFVDGASYTADENYLRESILKPNVHLVEGYSPAMPSFEGQLSESDLAGLLAYIKSIDGTGPKTAPAATTAQQPAVDLTKLSPAERGKLIYEKGKGAGAPCLACHSLDGSKLVGPTYKGLYGKEGKWADGQTYTATDDYIKESILNPAAHVAEGFAPAMPPYQGILNDDDIKDVIEFIKTVK